MIELRDINKTFDLKSGKVTALHDINLQVAEGEIFGVIGRSGAGKSTLIRCVNLLERPDSGRVLIDQQDLMQMSAAALRQVRHRIGMVFQHFNLLASRTVAENIALPLQLMHRSRAEITRKVDSLVELVGLANRQHAYPAQLSGGQKQRVAIARALATDPRVLLCDEMTSALDPETTLAILQLVQEINQRLKLSILLITHEMPVIKNVADKVAVLDQGQIVECGEVMQIFRAPKNEVTRSLVQTTLEPDLPTPLRAKLQASPIADGRLILRLTFIGVSARQPIIADLIRHYKVSINILQANLEIVHHDTIGVMLLAIGGDETAVQEAITYFKQQHIEVEALGYVASNDWTY